MDSPSKPTYVADTVALLFRLEQRRMGADAANAFSDAEQGHALLYISAFALAEIMYLHERGRISIGVEEVARYIGEHPESILEAPLNLQVVREALQITDVPELHDRLIAATARAYGAILITNDTTLRLSKFVQAVW